MISLKRGDDLRLLANRITRRSGGGAQAGDFGNVVTASCTGAFYGCRPLRRFPPPGNAIIHLTV